MYVSYNALTLLYEASCMFPFPTATVNTAGFTAPVAPPASRANTCVNRRRPLSSKMLEKLLCEDSDSDSGSEYDTDSTDHDGTLTVTNTMTLI